MWRIVCLCALFAVLAVSCGPGASAPAVTVPPLTVSPPPTPAFSGTCDTSRDLANWLESSMFYAQEFADLVSQAVGKPVAGMVEDVVYMARMRADFGQVAAPDCAENTQRMILEAMTDAVEGFQAFINGEASQVDGVAADVLRQMDQVSASHDGLMARLETQLQAQQESE